jgi:hypothetical protein
LLGKDLCWFPKEKWLAKGLGKGSQATAPAHGWLCRRTPGSGLAPLWGAAAPAPAPTLALRSRGVSRATRCSAAWWGRPASSYGPASQPPNLYVRSPTSPVPSLCCSLNRREKEGTSEQGHIAPEVGQSRQRTIDKSSGSHTKKVGGGEAETQKRSRNSHQGMGQRGGRSIQRGTKGYTVTLRPAQSCLGLFLIPDSPLAKGATCGEGGRGRGNPTG